MDCKLLYKFLQKIKCFEKARRSLLGHDWLKDRSLVKGRAEPRHGLQHSSPQSAFLCTRQIYPCLELRTQT